MKPHAFQTSKQNLIFIKWKKLLEDILGISGQGVVK